MIMSALGWVALVLSVALALFVGKPAALKRGYEHGSQVQAQENIKSVDEAMAARGIEGENYTVLGRVLEVSDRSVIITPLNPILINPLRREARQQVLLVDRGTVLEQRLLLSQEEYQQALADAERRGLTTDRVRLFSMQPLTLDQVKPGDEIEATPMIARDALKDQYAIKRLIKIISNQSPQL